MGCTCEPRRQTHKHWHPQIAARRGAGADGPISSLSATSSVCNIVAWRFLQAFEGARDSSGYAWHICNMEAYIT